MTGLPRGSRFLSSRVVRSNQVIGHRPADTLRVGPLRRSANPSAPGYTVPRPAFKSTYFTRVPLAADDDAEVEPSRGSTQVPTVVPVGGNQHGHRALDCHPARQRVAQRFRRATVVDDDPAEPTDDVQLNLRAAARNDVDGTRQRHLIHPRHSSKKGEPTNALMADDDMDDISLRKHNRRERMEIKSLRGSPRSKRFTNACETRREEMAIVERRQQREAQRVRTAGNEEFVATEEEVLPSYVAVRRGKTRSVGPSVDVSKELVEEIPLHSRAMLSHRITMAAADKGASSMEDMIDAIQRNKLKNVRTQQMFRCQRCAAVFPAAPVDVLKTVTKYNVAGGARPAKAGSRDRRMVSTQRPRAACAKCGGNALQWLRGWSHKLEVLNRRYHQSHYRSEGGSGGGTQERRHQGASIAPAAAQRQIGGSAANDHRETKKRRSVVGRLARRRSL